MTTGLKTTGRRIELTRLESWATPGVPDVICCAEDGSFSFLELKVLHGKSRKVALSPHQVSWQTRNGHGRTYVVVRATDLGLRLYLGADCADLCLAGLDSVEAMAVFSEPYDWPEFWRLTAPGGSV